MSEPIITHNRRRSRLSTLIDQPGGISTRTALRQASENLAGLEQRSAEMLEATIAELAALPLPSSSETRLAQMERAYALASGIIDAAGPFGHDDLCAAAYNLCDLLDAGSADTNFDWRIVTVHVQSFKLLMALPSDQKLAKEQVLQSLKHLRAKVSQS